MSLCNIAYMQIFNYMYSLYSVVSGFLFPGKVVNEYTRLTHTRAYLNCAAIVLWIAWHYKNIIGASVRYRENSYQFGQPSCLTVGQMQTKGNPSMTVHGRKRRLIFTTCSMVQPPRKISGSSKSGLCPCLLVNTLIKAKCSHSSSRK